MKRSAVLIALGACALGLSGARAPMLTYSSPGLRVPDLLAEIGPKLGLTLKVDKELANDFLVVRFAGVSSGQALDKIAEATHATWQKLGDAMVLRRTQQDHRDLESIDAAAQLKIIRDGQEDLAAEMAKQGDFSPDAASQLAQAYGKARQGHMPFLIGRQARVLGQQTPIGRALIRIATELPANEFLNIDPHGRAVWSTSPTSLQRPLGDTGADAVSNLMREQETWSAAVRVNGAPQESMPRFMPRMRGADGFSGSLAHTPFKLRFAAERNGPMGGVGVSLEVVGADGQTLTSARTTMYKDPDEPPARAAGDPTVPFPEESKPFAPYFGRTGAGSGMPDDIKEKFFHPDRFEPLRMVVGPELLAMAEAKGVNAVLDVPDSAMGSLTFTQPNESLGADQVLARAEDRMSFHKSPGWITGWPTLPVYDAQARADRAELGKLVQFVAGTGPKSIEQACEFSLLLPEPDDSYMAEALAHPFGEAGLLMNGDQPVRALYASLSPKERQEARTDGIRVNEIHGRSETWMNRILFGPRASLVREVSVENGLSVSRGVESLEPTELFAGGIPDDAYLKIDDVMEEGAAYADDVTPMFPVPLMMTADELARQIDRPIQQHGSRNGVQFTRTLNGSNIQFVKRRTVTLLFVFSPSVRTSDLRLQGADVSATVAPDYNALPADFKASVQQALGKLRNSGN